MEYEKAVMIMREVISYYMHVNKTYRQFKFVKCTLPLVHIADDGTEITEALIDEAFNKIRNG
tara:strand:+ start:463 stop:648 length:186 start_codon:yes stop_codon:yes gene_type:complete